MTREDWLHEEKETLTLLKYIANLECRDRWKDVIEKAIKRRIASNEAVYAYLPEGEL